MKLPALAFGVLVSLDSGPSLGEPSGSAPFFDFDAVDHYFAPLDEDKVFSLIPEGGNWEHIPESIRFAYGIMTDDEPQGIPEHTSMFADKLTDIGYTRKTIDTTHIATLNDIFRERPEAFAGESACPPIYRDILLFKKNDKVIGIAKICFECHQAYIVGAEANTESFGQHGEYGRLARILR